MSSFPVTRLRRLRRTSGLRGLVRETRLSLDDFVMPLFVGPEPFDNDELPGLRRHSVETVVREADELVAAGVKTVILFGIPEEKDDEGSGAWDDDGIVQRALRALKAEVPGLLLMTDVCLCEYTAHGHCGVVRDGEVQNDETLDLLVRTAVSHVEAGAQVVAPSDMMDGRVAAIREALPQTPIVAYSAKYASAFYGPFREAADSAPAFGDRRGYQMDPANVREALRECELDVREGADVLIVKPALPNLDVIRAVRERFDLPVAAYNVSGEYAMVRAAAASGWMDERQAALESLTAIRRAGADEIVRLVSSGTEAAMSAVRLARGHTRRDRILKFAGCYHGHADSLLVEAGSGVATFGIPATPGIPTALAAHTIVCPFNDLDAAAAAVAQHGEGLACVIVEPVAGNMGVVPPTPGFLEGLRQLCDASGALP